MACYAHAAYTASWGCHSQYGIILVGTSQRHQIIHKTSFTTKIGHALSWLDDFQTLSVYGQTKC